MGLMGVVVAGEGGAEHVLLINEFSPMIKTKDLEDLLRPYAAQGVSIRWIDDTSVAAVFRTPALGNMFFPADSQTSPLELPSKYLETHVCAC